MDDNLNQLPNTPEDLQKMFDQMEKGEDINPEPKPDDQAENKPDESAGKTEKVEAKEEDAPEADGEAEGIATKDGKHIIPYSVLKNERERAARAEQIARDAQERLAAMEEKLNAEEQGAKKGEAARAEPQEGDISASELEALKDDFPTVYKAVIASIAASKAVADKLAPVEESVRDAESARQQTMVEAVQEAIDATPKMAFLQATNAEAFELAKQFDEALRTQQAWAGKPLAERFAKVVEMVESVIGQIDIPGKAKPSLSAEELARAARAKAEKDSSRNSVPSSLSDFPAGNPPAQDEQDAIEQMTHQQLAAKFARMSADEMDAYFRSL